MCVLTSVDTVKFGVVHAVLAVPSYDYCVSVRSGSKHEHDGINSLSGYSDSKLTRLVLIINRANYVSVIIFTMMCSQLMILPLSIKET